MTIMAPHMYLSETFRELAARYENIGMARALARDEARGVGRAVLFVLEARGVPVSPAIREQVLACTDLIQVNSWLRRAVTASTAEDVVRCTDLVPLDSWRRYAVTANTAEDVVRG